MIYLNQPKEISVHDTISDPPKICRSSGGLLFYHKRTIEAIFWSMSKLFHYLGKFIQCICPIHVQGFFVEYHVVAVFVAGLFLPLPA